MNDRTVEQIEDELDELQKAYLEEDDDEAQLGLEIRFARLLDEATELDGVLRTAVGVTLTNWVRS